MKTATELARAQKPLGILTSPASRMIGLPGSL
jgi:hypothetical protein